MHIIQVQDVWKKFRIPHEKRTTILENIAGILQILEGKRFTYEEFWALKAVDFSIERGESIGIIGENGSGKSTLLKLMANIMRPDKGSVNVSGKVAPILELGLGFHPDLTVKENVLIYGSIMGLKNSEVKKRMDSIIEFAGIERFRDTKLKSLSSGMMMRLAFSVAIEVKPDIFLVDEAFAVGDIEFQEKCLDKFKQFQAEKKTIVLVSHALSFVRDFCKRAVCLSKGEVVAVGEAGSVVETYMKRAASG